MKHVLERFKNALFLLGFLWILMGTHTEFQQIASGTGNWRGEFSLVWFALYLTFVFFILSLFLLVGLFLYKKETLLPFIDNMIDLRNRWNNLRWLPWFFIFILPVCFFQYSMWGVVFQHSYIRILVWLITVFCLAF